MIGIQIYTVRALTQTVTEAEKAMRELMDMGYECIQLAGGIDNIAKDAEAAKGCGIKVIGILTNPETCEENLDRVIEIAKELGACDVGISGHAKTLAETEEFAKKANIFAKAVVKAGLTFSYHNHSHEFVRLENGKTVMENLLSLFDKETVSLMPDTYWLQHGGIDVRDFIEKYGERVKILHLKDMKRTEEGVTFAEVGEGNLNMEGIIDVAKSKGINSFIVEQDACDGSPLVSAKISIKNLKGLLK